MSTPKIYHKVKYVTCTTCGGTGEVDGEDVEIIPCPDCDGTGKIEDDSDFTGEE